MKTRATSFLLAVLAVVSLVLPALAAGPVVTPEENIPAQSGETVEMTETVDAAPAGGGEQESEAEPTEESEGEPTAEPAEESEDALPSQPEQAASEEAAAAGLEEEVDSDILVDGEPAAMEYEIRDGVCYVTVRSFVNAVDPEAVVTEEDGVVRVNALTVTQVIPAAMSAADGQSVQTQAASTTASDLELTAGAGGSYFTANGRYLYVDGGLIDLNGSVAAPVRQLARVFNLNVGYDNGEGEVLLDHQEGVKPYLDPSYLYYDNDTLYWLSRIIYCESGNQPLAGKIAVGNVVMNRLKDPRFPNSIYDVLFQKNQFGPASSGTIYRDPNWDSFVAAMLVMDGAQVTPDALYFNSARAKSGVARTKTYVTTIGDHAFYK